jgi:hypothetical protein
MNEKYTRKCIGRFAWFCVQFIYDPRLVCRVDEAKNQVQLVTSPLLTPDQASGQSFGEPLQAKLI